MWVEVLVLGLGYFGREEGTQSWVEGVILVSDPEGLPELPRGVGRHPTQRTRAELGWTSLRGFL